VAKLVKVTFGNFTSVTIMSNKVIAFKFPFERAGPHSTESSDLSNCNKVPFQNKIESADPGRQQRGGR
jgi:hypothetical protein